MIYSAGFEGLPGYAREFVYHRLADILTGKDQSAVYSHISPADRAAALQILSQTKPAFAAFVQSMHARAASTPAPPAG
jgi:hypothetical protein